jgi:hypothetical protein
MVAYDVKPHRTVYNKKEKGRNSLAYTQNNNISKSMKEF